MFENLFNRYYWYTLIVVFIGNILLVTSIWSVAFASSYEGTASWSWDAFGKVWSGLFGSLSNLFGLLLGIAFFVLMAIIARIFSKKGHHNLVAVWFLVGVVGGGAILYFAVPWHQLGFGFIPAIVLIVFTMIETIPIKLVANRSRSTK